MLIRSQDKKVLCNYNSGIVTCFEKYDYEVINNSMVPTKIEGYNIFFSNNGNEILLGVYSTVEKAVKVLDMIENAYCTMKQNECTLSISFETIAMQNSEIFEAFLKECRKVFIYQMPQDEEVGV